MGKEFLTKADATLSRVMAQIPEPEIESTHNVFHDLMSCILEQQIHYRSTKKTFRKMLDRASLDRLTLENFAQFEEKAFENAGFSMGKYETIEKTIDFFGANKTDWQLLTDGQVREKLSSIKGIGNWTIDMILLYTLQRPNVFPADDFHLKQIMTSLYSLDPNVRLKAQMMDVAGGWGEHKSLAVRYLLAWKEHNKKSSKN